MYDRHLPQQESTPLNVSIIHCPMLQGLQPSPLQLSRGVHSGVPLNYCPTGFALTINGSFSHNKYTFWSIQLFSSGHSSRSKL